MTIQQGKYVLEIAKVGSFSEAANQIFIADIFVKFLIENGSESYRFAIRKIKIYNVIHEVETAHSDIGIITIKDGGYEIMKRYLGKKETVI